MADWGSGPASSGWGNGAATTDPWGSTQATASWATATAVNETPKEVESGDVAQAENGVPKPVENPQSKGWRAKEALDYATLHDRAAPPDTQWGHSRPKYEYVLADGQDVGDVGPRVQELEDQLFKDEYKVEAGRHMHAYSQYTIHAEGPESITPVRSFEDAGLHPIVVENTRLMKYQNTTPIQSFVIPAIKQGHDVIAIAQTGSGKTAAYMVPIFSILMGKAKKLAKPRPNPLNFNPATDGICAEPLVLILCPTRELALQIFDDARRLSYRSMLRPCLAYGGGPRREQLDDMKRGCDILIGTPGRLKDFLMQERRWLSLNRLRFTVLDEADEMLKDDWQEEMSCMLGGSVSQVDATHQYMMFSATFPKATREVARKYLQADHLRVKVGRVGSVHKNVYQTIIWVDEDKKQQALMDLILSEPPSRTLIFVNSTHKADIVDDVLYNNEFPVISIHSGKTQLEREGAIRSFRQGKTPILVATAVSARGLDIKNVMHIINYDLPTPEHGGITEYIHRVGRTARIGHMGRATSFYNDRNEGLAEALVKTLMETEQEVPDFLSHFKPEQLTWEEDDSDKEEEKATNGSGAGASAAAGDSWGASNGGGAASGQDSNGWGSETTPGQNTTGWDGTPQGGNAGW